MIFRVGLRPAPAAVRYLNFSHNNVLQSFDLFTNILTSICPGPSMARSPAGIVHV